jgi:Zn-dependent metalloprotease
VLGRNGIDGKGSPTTLRVHYDTEYDNAFWSDSCFCMTFGDGRKFKSLEALDVLGHEVSHGVCATTANLEYFGESGGLNEANSDIMGTMVEFYAHAGHGSVIGDRGANWLIGEQLETGIYAHPLRYMYKPSKDGHSPDTWKCGLADLNPHRSSGPMNRCFFFLSHGAVADKASDRHTTLLPRGMAGIGNDKAARIWYRAMSTYLTSLDGYAEARDAAIAAAQDLYGAGSRAEAAVWNAFHGIDVGPAWSGPAAPDRE